MVPWGQAVPASLPPFPHHAAAITATNVVRGIARMIGMALVPVPGATGDTDTNLSAKIEAALCAADRYPFVLLHINGADEAAHRKNPAQKRAFLQLVDALVTARLLQSPHALTIACDHQTDPHTGLHGGGLQPLYTRAAIVP